MAVGGDILAKALGLSQPEWSAFDMPVHGDSGAVLRLLGGQNIPPAFDAPLADPRPSLWNRLQELNDLINELDEEGELRHLYHRPEKLPQALADVFAEKDAVISKIDYLNNLRPTSRQWGYGHSPMAPNRPPLRKWMALSLLPLLAGAAMTGSQGDG